VRFAHFRSAVASFFVFLLVRQNLYPKNKVDFLILTVATNLRTVKLIAIFSCLKKNEAVWQRKKMFEDPVVSADEVLQYTKEIGERNDLTDDEKAKLMAAKILKSKEKSRIHYRINGVRQFTGGRRNEIELPSHLEKVSQSFYFFS
jgi:hypothetical protein